MHIIHYNGSVKENLEKAKADVAEYLGADKLEAILPIIATSMKTEKLENIKVTFSLLLGIEGFYPILAILHMAHKAAKQLEL